MKSLMRLTSMQLTLMRVVATGALLAASTAHATDPVFSNGWRFDQRDGAALYRAICAGCHMPQGQGAQGAGAYPALAGNAKLVSAAYVETMVLYGRKAMPAFGGQLDDEQVASVVNYVRRELGPASGEAAKAADVAALRH